MSGKSGKEAKWQKEAGKREGLDVRKWTEWYTSIRIDAESVGKDTKS